MSEFKPNVAKYVAGCPDDPIVLKLANLPCSDNIYQNNQGDVFLVLDSVEVVGSKDKVLVCVSLDGSWKFHAITEHYFEGPKVRFTQVLPPYIKDEILNGRDGKEEDKAQDSRDLIVDIIKKVMKKLPKLEFKGKNFLN